MKIVAPGVDPVGPRPVGDAELASLGVNPVSEEAREVRETGTAPLKGDNKRIGEPPRAETEEKKQKLDTPEGAPVKPLQEAGTSETRSKQKEEPSDAANKAERDEKGEADTQAGGEAAAVQSTSIIDASTQPKEAYREDKSEVENQGDPDKVGSGEEVAGLVQLAAERVSNATVQAKEAATQAIMNAAAATKEAARKYGAAAVIDAERFYEVGKEKVEEWKESSKTSITGAAQRATVAVGQALHNSGEKLVAAGKPLATGGEHQGAGEGESRGGNDGGNTDQGKQNN